MDESLQQSYLVLSSFLCHLLPLYLFFYLSLALLSFELLSFWLLPFCFLFLLPLDLLSCFGPFLPVFLLFCFCFCFSFFFFFFYSYFLCFFLLLCLDFLLVGFWNHLRKELHPFDLLFKYYYANLYPHYFSFFLN